MGFGKKETAQQGAAARDVIAIGWSPYPGKSVTRPEHVHFVAPDQSELHLAPSTAARMCSARMEQAPIHIDLRCEEE